MTAATCCYGIKYDAKYKGFLVNSNKVKEEWEMEMDVTVRIKLQPEWGWVLTGRYGGRNVNVIFFAFLKEPFRHLSRSSSALSGSERLGKSLVWWRYRGCTFPGSWETCPHAIANPRCRVSGAQTSSPRGGQEPGMEIPQRCRLLQGSGPCSDRKSVV